jgi:hypothetical protein
LPDSKRTGPGSGSRPASLTELPPFIPGLDLCQRFFQDAVAPLLADAFPTLVYSAGRLDRGSDVLGFDTPLSRDHHWGPRVTLFLSEPDHVAHAPAIDDLMAQQLPVEVQGYPTHFHTPEIDGGRLTYRKEHPIQHGVTVTTPSIFFTEYLGVDATGRLTAREWLAIPSQLLRTVRSGRVFHDGLEVLGAIRERLHWYPRDVWLYLMANQWRRIDQEMPFVGRTGDVGDDLGSRLLVGRLVIEAMRLAFLQERRYPPYFKWFGTAFGRLTSADWLHPHFQAALGATAWPERETALNAVYTILGEQQDALALTDPVGVEIDRFHKRPYRVANASAFRDALLHAVDSQEVRSLPPNVGAVWQFVDATDLLDPESWAHVQFLGAIHDS